MRRGEWGIGGQGEVCGQDSQDDPGAGVGHNQTGILPDEADPRFFGQGSFMNGGGVYAVSKQEWASGKALQLTPQGF